MSHQFLKALDWIEFIRPSEERKFLRFDKIGSYSSNGSGGDFAL